MNKAEQIIVNKFFQSFAPTHAIVRVNEALFFKRLKLKPPILDLGCGDGKFALLTFGQKRIDMGLDVDRKQLNKAMKIKSYKKVMVSNASQIPFGKGSFNSIISNSVLEHVENLDNVLKESYRVLGKKGELAITVPTPVISQYFFWSKFIPGWAAFKNRLWKHVNFFDEPVWRNKLKKAGFTIVKIEKTNSKKAIFWADVLFFLFPIGSLAVFMPFLQKKKVFGLDKYGGTLLILAQKNE